MEQIGYLMAIIVILGVLAIIIWEYFIIGLKFVLFVIGLSIVVAIYEYIQANIELLEDMQNIFLCSYPLYFLHAYGDEQEKENRWKN